MYDARCFMNILCGCVCVCVHLEYDLDGYLGLSPKLCTPEEVIKEGRGVCSGFSIICLEMCR